MQFVTIVTYILRSQYYKYRNDSTRDYGMVPERYMQGTRIAGQNDECRSVPYATWITGWFRNDTWVGLRAGGEVGIAMNK